MKQFNLLFIILPILWIILSSTGGKPKPPWEKKNVSFPMMIQEIRHSMQENGRQKKMKDWQTTNAISENSNQKQWSKFRETSTKIQDRLRIVSFAMQAIPTGVVISQEASKTKKIQNQIIEEIKTAPYSLLVALPKQIQFVDDLQMVVRLLTGIVASYGAINQMEKSERKILLDYALGEVITLHRKSTIMLMEIRQMKEKVRWQKIMLDYYTNRDKKIVKDIIGGLKNF